MPDRNALLVIIVGAIFGGSFLFMRIAAPEVGGVFTASARILIAASVLAVLGGRAHLRAAWPRRRWFLVLGLFQVALPFTLIAGAEAEIDASLGAVLNGTVPLFAALVGAAWFGVPLRRRTMSAIALGVVGLLIAVGRPSVDGAASIVPVLAMIGACASYGVGVNVAKRRFAGVPTMTVAVGQLVAAAALVLPLGLTSIPSLMPSPATIASLVALGVLCTAVAWPLLFRVVARFGAVAGSSVTLVIPLFGILWGVLLLGETPSAGLVGGTAVIATSLLLIFDVPILALARRLIHPETATQELPRAG